MKPKVALVKDGFLPPGSENKRGRLSGAAKTRLSELASQGWSIEGYSKAEPKPEPKPKAERKTAKPKSDESGGIFEIPDIVRDETSWQASYQMGGKTIEVGMREVCNSCSNSFTHCYCPVTLFNGAGGREVVIDFKPLKNPLPRKKWW